MSIQFRGMRNAGELKDERVVLHVLENDDVGRYALFRTQIQEDDVVSGGDIENAYWFPDKPVRKGDLIILYTKVGKDKDKVNEDKTTSHFFYWGLPTPIWGDMLDVPVLIHASGWLVFPRETKKKKEEIDDEK